ncbi:MAG: COR domain-containing protein, partial [Planctomycetota bacterium]
MNQEELLKIIEQAARAGRTELNLRDKNLTSVPAEIGQLKDLTRLNLSNNNLTSVPAEIGQLKNLTELDLLDNNLTSLPREIGQLKELTGLYLGANNLSSLPAEIGQLKELTGLYLGGNDLTVLPAEIGQLKNLRRLHLYDNNLTSLPAEIGQLEKLRVLHLHGSDGLGIPPEVLGPDCYEEEEPARAADIIEYYFRQRREARRELREAKVLLVGQGGVGKTSLVKRLIDNKYNPAELKTEGIDIRGWEVAGRRRKSEKTPRIKLNVWDFGGQEIMHATHQFFLTKRSLYILVLDARKGKNESNIGYWLKIIQSYGGESPVLVVTNKCDGGHLDLNENRLTKDYAPNIKGFFNVSCQEGDGIKELKAAIKRHINGLEHVYDKVPESYFNVKQELERRTGSEDFIDIKDYRKLCRRHKVRKEQEQNLLLRFLHDLGNVLNFGDPKDPYHLRDMNILNPEWVTEGVYRIINNNELMRKGGVLEWGMIGKILNDPKGYPEERHEFIVDMMRKFELCFDFPEGYGRRVLVPELLGENEPELGWDYDDSLNFEYHYTVLPSGLICRFIVRMHHNLTKKRTYWRSGVVLDIDGNKALVRADVDKGRMFISVKGAFEGRRRALAVIRNSFEGIHATIPRLDVKAKVPLPNEEGVEGVVVDYAHLVKLEETGIAEFLPEGAEKMYKVKELLEGVDVQGFDVFLCHNSEDKAAVKRVAKDLEGRGVKVWLDEWELRPGVAWQRALEEQIEEIKSAAVFVGERGIGPWQQMELEAFLREFVSR